MRELADDLQKAMRREQQQNGEQRAGEQNRGDQYKEGRYNRISGDAIRTVHVKRRGRIRTHRISEERLYQGETASIKRETAVSLKWT